ncbi:MAG: ribosome small subunit-dependent GTPase A [Candidatus Gracilibacteria bacterium]|nr:ribosome small subunit-dependent GTPase A [Candidatus Gracilibacteria bacterium]
MGRYSNKYDKNQRKKTQNKIDKSEKSKNYEQSFEKTWDEFESSIIKDDCDIAIVTQITANHEGKTFYLYDIVNQKDVIAKMTKSLPKELSKSIVVGDNVLYSSSEEGTYIERRENRKNKFARIKSIDDQITNGPYREQIFAVNLDYGIIVVSACKPKFNPGMVERYLLLFEYHGVTPIICITKTDIQKLAQEEYQLFLDLGIEIYFITPQENDELERLKNTIENKRVVFVGTSGVGKTSLTNNIYGAEVGKEGETHKKTGFGQHTTTASCAYKWKDNSFIIDTPGIMNLNLVEVNRQNLKYLFSDFLELNNECKYKKCTHIIEPDCAVQSAYVEGRLAKSRYDFYIQLFEKIQ